MCSEIDLANVELQSAEVGVQELDVTEDSGSVNYITWGVAILRRMSRALLHAYTALATASYCLPAPNFDSVGFPPIYFVHLLNKYEAAFGKVYATENPYRKLFTLNAELKLAIRAFDGGVYMADIIYNAVLYGTTASFTPHVKSPVIEDKKNRHDKTYSDVVEDNMENVHNALSRLEHLKVR